MPYKIEKVPGGYYVVSTRDGHRHSIRPLSLETAERQMRALNYTMLVRGEFAR
jgi:hypothetical protein